MFIVVFGKKQLFFLRWHGLRFSFVASPGEFRLILAVLCRVGKRQVCHGEHTSLLCGLFTVGLSSSHLSLYSIWFNNVRNATSTFSSQLYQFSLSIHF